MKKREKSPPVHQSALKVKEEYKNRFSQSVSNMENIIQSGNVFVDKTLLIKEILNDGSESILITRPRRWGKTLNMMMLRTFLNPDSNIDGTFKNLHFFTGGTDNVNLNELDKKKCLKIMTVDDGHYVKYAGTIPTIFLTFSHVAEPTKKYTYTYDYYFERIKQAMNAAYLLCTHAYCKYLEKIVGEYYSIILNTKYDKENISQTSLEFEVQKYNIQLPHPLKQFAYWTKNPSEIILEEAIINLVRMLSGFYGEKPYVIIDEYDGPVNNISDIDDKKKILSLIRDILQPIVKDGSTEIKKVILTGIYEIAKTDMLSGLNNLVSYTVEDTKYSEWFGFTEFEVNELLDKTLAYTKPAELIEQKELIREWYNGYNIGNYKIYNPWSIINCLETTSRGDMNPLQPYWVNTGGQYPLISVFKKIDKYNKVFELINIEYLVLKKAIPKRLNLNLAHDSDSNEKKIKRFWAILLHAGYLTTHKEKNYQDAYHYIIPNKEVKADFYRSFLKALIKQKSDQIKFNISEKLSTFIECFESCDSLKENFQELILNNLKDHSEKTESDFHNLLGAIIQVGLFEMKIPKYFIRHEMENSDRKKIDSIFIPNKGQSTTLIIHEYKKVNSNILKKAEEKAEDALWQIYSKNYLEVPLQLHQEALHNHIKNIIVRGIVFYKSLSKETWNILIKEHQMTIDEAEKINRELFRAKPNKTLPDNKLLSGETSTRKNILKARKIILDKHRCLDDLIEMSKARKRIRKSDENEVGHINKKRKP